MKRLMFDRKKIKMSSSVVEEEFLGKKLKFELYQNHRDQSLYMNIFGTNNEEILLGKKIVKNMDILDGLIDERLAENMRVECRSINQNTLSEPNVDNIMKEFYIVCEV